MSTSLTAQLSAARAQELRDLAARHRRRAGARSPRRSRPSGQVKRMAPGAVTIRWSGALGDAAALRRLAALDSQPPLSGAVLVAEVDGELRAALAPQTLDRLADPFYPTTDLLLLLALRARQLRHADRDNRLQGSLGAPSRAATGTS
jgi:hypothetical protein